METKDPKKEDSTKKSASKQTESKKQKDQEKAPSMPEASNDPNAVAPPENEPEAPGQDPPPPPPDRPEPFLDDKENSPGDQLREELKKGIDLSKDKILPSMIALESLVYPSAEKTIFVEHDDKYGGAHKYVFRNSLGFDKEKGALYDNSYTEINFVQKDEDGTIHPGIQSEQLLYALIDRHVKLDAQYPDKNNKEVIAQLYMALYHMEKRVKERIGRNVMGELKN
jgi:hypothetical protein